MQPLGMAGHDEHHAEHDERHGPHHHAAERHRAVERRVRPPGVRAEPCEVDPEKHEHRRQIEDALHDDRGEDGGDRQAFVLREQIGAQDFAGARGQEKNRGEPDHGGAKRHPEPGGAQRFEQVLPALRADQVHHEGEHDRQRQQLGPRPAHLDPDTSQIRIAKKEPQQADRQRGHYNGADGSTQIRLILHEVDCPRTTTCAGVRGRLP